MKQETYSDCNVAGQSFGFFPVFPLTSFLLGWELGTIGIKDRILVGMVGVEVMLWEVVGPGHQKFCWFVGGFISRDLELVKPCTFQMQKVTSAIHRAPETQVCVQGG